LLVAEIFLLASNVIGGFQSVFARQKMAYGIQYVPIATTSLPSVTKNNRWLYPLVDSLGITYTWEYCRYFLIATFLIYSYKNVQAII
jgi:hypothetical protein